jgi:hypothetical protein
MIEVSVLDGNLGPVAEGIAFELLAQDGTVIGSAATDAAGVVTFDVDSQGLGPVAVRCAADTGDGDGQPAEGDDAEFAGADDGE